MDDIIIIDDGKCVKMCAEWEDHLRIIAYKDVFIEYI